MLKPFVLALFVAVGCLTGLSAQAARTPLELDWQDLLPPADPDTAVEQLFNSYDLDKILKSDEALNDFIDQATDLTVNPALNGKLVKLPGYVVPLELNEKGSTEFLLVPYYGACIHVPPPPINQTVYVKTPEDDAAPIRGNFDLVWVIGIMTAEKQITGFANAGYKIESIEVTRFQ